MKLSETCTGVNVMWTRQRDGSAETLTRQRDATRQALAQRNGSATSCRADATEAQRQRDKLPR